MLTGLELGEMQVGQDVFFTLGLVRGFLLSGGNHVRNEVSCFGKALYFGFLFLIDVARLEKARVQEGGGVVCDGPSCRSGISLHPRASSPPVPVPLSRSPAPSPASSHPRQRSPLPCHLIWAKLLPPTAVPAPAAGVSPQQPPPAAGAELSTGVPTPGAAPPPSAGPSSRPAAGARGSPSPPAPRGRLPPPPR